jgi:transglutaminase-like putative cysteine protease
MRYTVRHETIYSYTDLVPVCHNRVHLTPRSTARQVCHEHQLSVIPLPATHTQRPDYFGNEVDYFSIQEAHAGLRVTSSSVVEVAANGAAKLPDSPAWEDIAAQYDQARLANDEARMTNDEIESVRHSSFVIFKLPSPRITPSAALADYARPSFAKGRPIVDAARDLTARIHAEFAFDPKATTIHTPPEETLALGRGVCQDFAHLAIGCLRSLGLPARYVSGYVCTTPPPGRPRLQGADASHAWISVHCGPLGWIDFDPTNNCVGGESHVTIGWGRDYGDVCPIQGVFVGGGQHRMIVAVDVVPAEDKKPAK